MIVFLGPVALHVHRAVRKWEHGVEVRRIGVALELWKKPAKEAVCPGGDGSLRVS